MKVIEIIFCIMGILFFACKVTSWISQLIGNICDYIEYKKEK